MKMTRALGSCALIAAVVALMTGSVRADQSGHSHSSGTPAHDHTKGPVRITMEELHKHGGVPPGWQFTVPTGDPKAGRAVFTKLECHKCHAITGENFPSNGRGPKDVGPDLTGMGSHHPASYFLESILTPNAVILTGPGYTGPDGLSVMPDYRDSLMVGELINLVAYIKSLKGEHGHAGSEPAKPHQHAPKSKGH
jgi:mono/diheme cytochrome c family protein